MFEAQLIYFIFFLSFLVVVFFLKAKNILVVSLLNSTFSLFTVIMYLLLDAPDVAMTEAAVSVLASVFSIYAIRALYLPPYNFEDSFKPLLFLLFLGLASLLIYASCDLPKFGDAAAISHQKVAAYYLENTAKDINIPSIVAAILASYRGYDTLLETLVILIGGVSVLLVSERTITIAEKTDLLVTSMTRFIFPAILLFALYLQVHGEISPGGGFQAGAIIAISFILYSMSFGKYVFSIDKLKNIAVIGVGIYVLAGIIGLVKGEEFLNYNVLAESYTLSQKIGIITVELGVGTAVGATMLLIYFCLVLNDYASNQYKL